MNIKQLFGDAYLILTRPDRYNDTNIKDIKYFSCPTNVLGEDAVANIMVKNTLQNGHHIYTIELQELNKPAELKNQAVNDSSAGSKGSTLITRQDNTTVAEEPSNEDIAQKENDSKSKFSTSENKELQRNIESGLAAIEKIIKNQGGKVTAAMHRDDIVDIDVLWGYAGDVDKNFKNGYGISYIIARRELKNLNGELVAKLMPDVIINGEKARMTGKIFYLQSVKL